jgi:hypothetical protein
MRCIEMTGSDNRMDCREMFDEPINALPVKCTACGFPDLDHVPDPYFLVKSRTMSPNELAPAANGNFFVRERVRRVLELVAPDAFAYHTTHYRGTDEQTPWHLAVPQYLVETAEVAPSIKRCPTCNQPASAHPGTQYVKYLWDGESNHEGLKSSTWGSSESGWDQWLDQSLFFTVRLHTLLKKLKAKGLVELYGENTKPHPDETKWVNKQLEAIMAAGIPLHPAGTLGDTEAKWFKQYLKQHARADLPKTDWKAIEKKQRVKLPKSYKDFIDQVGPSAFTDIDELEGYRANILSPDQIDYGSYRLDVFKPQDGEPHTIDGIMFAATDHGDCFCFDVRKDMKEFAVYQYLHEGDFFEPYADNFAACLQRFAANQG